MTRTLLNEVNAVAKKAGLIQGSSGEFTSLTNSALQVDIDNIVKSCNLALLDLERCGVEIVMRAAGSITLVAGQREYDLPDRYTEMVSDTMIDETSGSVLVPYPGGFFAMRNLQTIPANFTGSPYRWCLNPTTGKLRLDVTPTAAEAGRVYGFIYRPSILLSLATDLFPIRDDAVEALEDCILQQYQRNRKGQFDQAAYQTSLARTAQIAAQLPQATRYGIRAIGWDVTVGGGGVAGAGSGGDTGGGGSGGGSGGDGGGDSGGGGDGGGGDGGDGGGGGGGDITPVPANVTAPVVTGSSPFYPGSVLSSTAGTWTNTPTTFAYQWFANSALIVGATSPTYSIDGEYAGQSIGCAVTASNAGGSSGPTNSNNIAAGIFDPSLVSGLTMWLDASDAASISASAGAVNQWNDKSGAGHHFTASSTARPTTGSDTVNGKNVITFDGAANVMTQGDFIYDQGSASIFIVFEADDQSAECRILMEGNAGVSNTPQYGFGLGSGALVGSVARFQYTTGAGVNRINLTGLTEFASDAPRIFAGIDAGGTFTAFQEGVQVSNAAYTRSTTLLTTLALGASDRATIASFYAGKVAEIVVYSGAVSDSNRLIITEYLRGKWLAPKTIELFVPIGQSNGDGRAATGLPDTTLATFYSSVYPNLLCFYKLATRQANALNGGSFIANGSFWNLGLAHNVANRTTHQTIGNAGSSVATQSASFYGPELEYGRQVYTADPTANLAVVKACIGGSIIESDWNITTPDSDALWTWFKTYVYQPAVAELISRNYTITFVKFFWMQGESDAVPALSAAYQASLQTLVTRCNTELTPAPDIIVIGGLSAAFSDADGVAVKAAQAAVAAANANTVLVATDGSANGPALALQVDNLHYTTADITTLGQRVYAARL